MSNLSKFLRFAFFFLGSSCVAVFIQFRRQVPSFTFSRHAYIFEPGSWAIHTVLILVVFFGLWAVFSTILTKAFRLSYHEALKHDFQTYFPIFFLGMTPLALIHYLTFTDLERRLALLSAAVVFALIYLKTLKAADLARQKPAPRPSWTGRFLALSERRQVLLLFIAALVLFNAGTLAMMSRGASFSGDEPHYLLITHSLLHDGDIDLADNYGRKDYARFLPPGATVRAHTVAGKAPDSRLSFHSPGVSVLLLPFYALGDLFGRNALAFLLRFGMSLFGALFGVQIYLYARREWPNEKLALTLWFLASFTAPVYFYSIHVYPEIVIALFALIVFRWLRFSVKFSTLKLLSMGFLLSSFLWFHALKYVFILAPLALYALWVLIRKRRHFRGAVIFLLPLFINAALYFVFQYSLYGSLNPTSVSWQGAMDSQQTLGFFKNLLTGIPFRFRIDTLLGYFLDQRDGLLFYAPVYFFALLGLFEFARRRKKDFWLLAFIAAPYVLVSAFLTQRTGYAPQARPLVAVQWALVIPLGYFLAANRKRIFGSMLNFAAGLSFMFVGFLCCHPFALYQETTVGTTERGGELFYRLSHLHFYLPTILPSFIKIDEWRWWPNFVWPAIVLLFIVAYKLVPPRPFSLKFRHHQVLTALGLLLFFAWFVFYPREFLVRPLKVAYPSGDKLMFYNLSRVARMSDPGRFSLLEDNRDYLFYFATWKGIDQLKVDFGSDYGDYALGLAFFDEPAFKTETRREVKTRLIDKPPTYRWKNLNLYRMTIRLDRISDVRTGINPYLFAIQPGR
jgi:hypothetical protein